MRIPLKRRVSGKFAFYETIVFGSRVSLSKNLVAALEKRDALHSDCAIPDDLAVYLRLTAQSTAKGDKTYTNIYLTLSKDCPDVQEVKVKKENEVAEEDVPF